MDESFNWDYPGLNWSHFHSLANLLSLRNGGQAEPSLLSNTLLQEDSDTEDDDDRDGHALSIDTRLAHKISESGHGRLKRRFLDCLAEFAANERGGTAVACSAMKEAEDSVTIWIARNEGFSNVDEPVFDTLAKLLGSLSGNNVDLCETLWKEMVSYQQNRVNNYIPNLRSSFKAYDVDGIKNHFNSPEDGSALDADLSILRSLLFDRNTTGMSTLEKHMQLVITSYKLRQTRNVEQLLYKSPSATSRSKSLWLDICLLARPRVAFQYFKDITLTLPSFKQVTIILIPCPPAPGNPSQGRLNLNQTFKILQIDLNPTTTQAVLGRYWTVDRTARDFAKRQKQKPNIHAEVQMLMFLNTNESSASGLFPYFGCSKLSCFMCHRFIQSHGRFTTRGCHGRLFKPWTVPNTNHLLPGQSDCIAKALILVQQEVVKKLKASVDDHIRHERTSFAGQSSVLDDQHAEDSERQLQIDRLRMKVERDRVAAMFRRQAEDTINSTRCIPSILEGNESDQECYICMRPTKRKCSLCNRDFICSESCEKKMFGRHLFTCSKRPITSADYLWKSLGEDLMPEEEDVLQDFGFTNVFGGDRNYLLGVYGGLYLSGNVSAEDIHEWRIQGILVDRIKDFYFAIPEDCRGGYFPWFLKNLHVLQQPMSVDEAQRKFVATFFEKARPYLSKKDRKTAANHLKPEAKRASYNLLAQMLHGVTPNPIESNWYSFGFVTCRGEGEESILANIYQLLITKSDGSLFYEINNRRRHDTQPATLEQFWKAYEAGKLIELIDLKDLTDRRHSLPFLQEFFSVPPAGPRPSVWNLKQFLEINQPIDYPPVSSVRVDYGFINCRNTEDIFTLMEIYGNVLKTADPLELHRACVAGELFEFASAHIQMKEKWRPLMTNLYSLDSNKKSQPDESSPGIFASLLSLFPRLWSFKGESDNQRPTE